MSMNAAAAKYVLTKEPPLPSKCIGCGCNDNADRQFVDLTQSIDYYGAILLCQDCAKEIANLVGFINEDTLALKILEFESVAQELVQAKEKVEALENVVRAYGLGQFVIDSEPDSSEDVSKDEESGEPPIKETE